MVSREQDVMIRAFDHVVRANRHDDKMAAVVIGNAIDSLSLMNEYKLELVKDFHTNIDRYPAKLKNWLDVTFRNPFRNLKKKKAKEKKVDLWLALMSGYLNLTVTWFFTLSF